MFNFKNFYKGLLERSKHFNPFDNYWSKFPPSKQKRFKTETIALLKENISNKDAKGLACTLAVIYHDGADFDFTDMLLFLLDQDWHTSQEDIVAILEMIKDPASVNKLYDLAHNTPENDDMRALAKKCMWALSAIGTQEAIGKLVLLQKSNDRIISENATFQLEHLFNEN